MREGASEGLLKFFESVWRDTQGWVYLPTIHKGVGATKYLYEWPRQREAVVKHVMVQDAIGNDVFYAPSLFREPKPEQEYVLGTHVFWLDFDGNAPADWEAISTKHGIPEPSTIIQSSVEGHAHVYWALSGFETNVDQIHSRIRSLTYTLGADSSGWDANQFLRPPFTHNYGFNNKGAHKDWYSGNPIEVSYTRNDDTRVNPNVFNPLGSPEHIVSQKINLGPIPELTVVLMGTKWPSDFQELFGYSKEEATTASPNGRSGSLARIGYYCAENGFTDEQAYAVLLDADTRWEKYSGRADQERRLIDIIARARTKHGYMAPDDITFASLIGDKAVPVVTDSKLVYSFKEFAALEVHVDWILEGLLRNEGMGIIVGPPNVGKTQLGIQIAAHAALGESLLGWENKTSPKKAILFSLEMGILPLQIFWEKIKENYTDQIDLLHKNLHVLPLGEGIPLDSAQGQQFFEKILSEYQPDLIVVDSLQKVTAKELSDEVSIKMMMEFLDRMRQRYHTAMIFIHHNRKKPNDSSGGVADLDDMYGSRYISANIEFVLYMQEIARNAVAITEVKNRLHEKRPRFEITRGPNLQYSLSGSPSTSSLEGLVSHVRDIDTSKPATGSSGEPTGGLGLFSLA